MAAITNPGPKSLSSRSSHTSSRFAVNTGSSVSAVTSNPEPNVLHSSAPKQTCTSPSPFSDAFWKEQEAQFRQPALSRDFWRKQAQIFEKPFFKSYNDEEGHQIQTEHGATELRKRLPASESQFRSSVHPSHSPTPAQPTSSTVSANSAPDSKENYTSSPQIPTAFPPSQLNHLKAKELGTSHLSDPMPAPSPDVDGTPYGHASMPTGSPMSTGGQSVFQNSRDVRVNGGNFFAARTIVNNTYYCINTHSSPSTDESRYIEGNPDAPVKGLHHDF